jgi:hypothetical protein
MASSAANVALVTCPIAMQAGLAAFPKDPSMLMLHANFLMSDVLSNYEGGFSQVSLCKRMNPKIWLQYTIFARWVITP